MKTEFLDDYRELFRFLCEKYPELLKDNCFLDKYLTVRKKVKYAFDEIEFMNDGEDSRIIELKEENKQLRRQIILAGVEVSLTKRDEIKK
jgi:hypothetical protein